VRQNGEKKRDLLSRLEDVRYRTNGVDDEDASWFNIVQVKNISSANGGKCN
jgi:hypothetical protein